MEDIEKEGTGGTAPAVPPSAADPAAQAGAGKDTAALALGVASVALCPSAVLGVGLGAAAVVSAGRHEKRFGASGKSRGGKACGVAGIALGVVWGVVWAAVIAFAVWTTSPGAVHGSRYGDPGAGAPSENAFEAQAAVVGLVESSEAPAVVLVGGFSNGSDEAVSFSDALDATASQGGRGLESAYLPAADALGREPVAPGETAPVLVGWELRDDDSDVEIVVYDRRCSERAVFEGAFTIEELLASTEAFPGELEDVLLVA